MAAAVSDAMNRERNVIMRVVPAGTDISRMALLAGNRAHVVWIGLGAHMTQEGVWDFAATEWGPQPIRIIAAGLPFAGMLYGTAKDANIKTYADLKGKRVADVTGYPSLTLIAEGCLAFGGLTWDDVERVTFPSFGTAGKGVIEGKTDAACCATYSSWTYELESAPRGLHFPPYPHADKEGWARLQKLNPVMQPLMATVGPGLSEDNPLETGTYSNPLVLAYDRIEFEMAYEMAKMLYELWPVYGKAKAPGIEQYDPKNRVYDYAIPYHEGAIKYYKEIGVWKPEHDKNNVSLVERQKVLAAAWNKAVDQGAVEKVKSKDFPAFWEKIRVKALEDAGFDVYYKK